MLVTMACSTRLEPAPAAESLWLSKQKVGVSQMLNVVITLLIIALIAGVLGFGGIAGAAVGIAKIVFVIALVLFLISLIAGGMRGSFGRRV